MTLHPLAGKPVPANLLINVPRLVAAYFSFHPDPSNPLEQVSFGTSGHRGTSTKRTFNEAHVLAITQAICDLRARAGVAGPLFVGIDTHALSEPALITAVEVLAGNGVQAVLEADLGYTPTPVVSHAILRHNRDRSAPRADGVVITPSHNPPGDGGYKYNPPSGGPADTATTRQIEARANELMREGLRDVQRIPFERAIRADTTQQRDLVRPYVEDLGSVLDLQAVADAGLTLGVHPLGGASVAMWDVIADVYRLNLEVVDTRVDPRFSMLSVDKDGQVRMDCSSPSAMAPLVALRERFDLAFGTDGDADRHGIVTRSAGLLPANHYLAVAIDYLCSNRAAWPSTAAIGKTLVSSSMIDRVAARLGRPVAEVPVGFKWFVEGLLDGSYVFGGEESAGAAFARRDGTVWTTDKDGPLMCLLAAELLAQTGKDPAEHYHRLEEEFGVARYERCDLPATPEQKSVLKALSPEQVTATELAGEPILDKLTRAPGNGAAIGGLKVRSENGWFAARPSGTENIYKIYAESFRGVEHLRAIQEQAQAIVDAALRTSS